MYTNEFCGLRIQIPEGERILETDFQEAKQKLEDILHYASYCAQSVQNKVQKNINLPIFNENKNRTYLSVFIDNSKVYAAKFQCDKRDKRIKAGVLSDKITVKEIFAIDTLRAQNKIYNFLNRKEQTLDQGFGVESAWKERIKQINKEREHTKGTHYDEYARMEHSSAKRNAERKFPVQQNRISTSKRPPSPVPVPPPGIRPSARTPVNGSLPSPAAGYSAHSAYRPDRLRQMMESKNPEAMQNYIEEAKERARQRSAMDRRGQKDRNIPQRESGDGRG